MGFTPLAGPGFDYQKHIETLRTKRETIKAFSHCTASILAKVTDKTTAAHWGNYLDNMLGFDTELSIRICEEQRQASNNPDNITRQLITLTEQREFHQRQLEQSVKALTQIMEAQTGEAPTAELLDAMTGPQRQIIATFDAQIAHIESQLKRMEKPEPAPADGA